MFELPDCRPGNIEGSRALLIRNRPDFITDLVLAGDQPQMLQVVFTLFGLRPQSARDSHSMTEENFARAKVVFPKL
jgi:hypothetical protein